MSLRIILDRGHGLSNKTESVFDPGASHAGFSESSLVTLVAGEARYRLRREANIPCILTPELSIPSVVKWTNAGYQEGDVLIALHMNSAAGPQGITKASGVEVVFHWDAGAERKRMAEAFGRKFASYCKLPFRRAITDLETPAGEKSGLPMLRDTKMPAYILEMGFINNPLDAIAIQERGAEALVWAIEEGDLF
jgi:N-acetylmuramoyl-L-alanine amidase